MTEWAWLCSDTSSTRAGAGQPWPWAIVCDPPVFTDRTKGDEGNLPIYVETQSLELRVTCAGT